jgi:hypothetical protein
VEPPALELDRDVLVPIVTRALGQGFDDLGDWTVSRIGYTAFNPVSEGLYRVSGSVRRDADTIRWSVVLKICRAPTDDDFAHIGLDQRERMRDVLRWDREAEAYGSGLLETLPPGLVAPRCFAIDRSQASARLWLEDISEEMDAWDVQRYALAARHLGRFNGTYLAGRPIPDYSWLSRASLPIWVAYFTRTIGPLLADDRVWAQPLTAELFPPATRADLRRLFADTDTWWRAFDRLPLALSHLDAFRANLLSRVGSHGVETVAVDWAMVGTAPLGAEVAHLVIASLFYHGDLADPEEVASQSLAGYAQGLVDAGYRVSESDLHRAYAINAIVRWGLIIGPLGAVGDPSREEWMSRTFRLPFSRIIGMIAARTHYLCSLSRGVELD